MPLPMAKPNDEVQLKTFDPITFYPALAAREKQHGRDDSVNTLPNKSVHEPAIPKDFDPAVFYPALAAQEKAKIAAVGRQDSSNTEFFFSSTSTSQSLPKPPPLPRGESASVQAKRVMRRRLWIIGSVLGLTIIIAVAVCAFLGSHHWYRNR